MLETKQFPLPLTLIEDLSITDTPEGDLQELQHDRYKVGFH